MKKIADVKWIKVVTDVFDDEKILLIESLPEADSIIVIWFKLLCLAGKQNNSGVFIMNNAIPYTDTMLATIFRRKDSTVKLALSTFERFGMIEIVNGAITIPNWGKHQNLDQLEMKREYMRGYMQDYRSKQKALSCKTNGKTNSKTNVSEADKKRKDKNRIDIDKNYSDVPAELLEPLKDFEEMRKKIKAPMTDKAKTMMLNKLNQLSNGDNQKAIQILNQSTMNCWKGLFPLSEDKKAVTASNAKPNKFHNFEQRITEYSEEEMNEIAERSNKKKLNKLGIGG